MYAPEQPLYQHLVLFHRASGLEHQELFVPAAAEQFFDQVSVDAGIMCDPERGQISRPVLELGVDTFEAGADLFPERSQVPFLAGTGQGFMYPRILALAEDVPGSVSGIAGNIERLVSLRGRRIVPVREVVDIIDASVFIGIGVQGGSDFVRGEPAESFPDSFIEQKTVRKILPDMTVVERVETIEPVASDLRAETRSRWKEALRYETVRIIASVLGLHPDDLEQRHRARHRKAVITLVSVIAAVCLGAAGIFAYLGHVAQTEGEIADQQAKLCVDIAERTMNELPEAFADEPVALEYIQQAVDSARSSLEELGLETPADTGRTGTGG